MNRINRNYGIIRSVSQDRSKIKIGMPMGGTFECRNEGFEVGQAVCFILDALGKRVLKVLPKEIADLQLFLGTNPALQEAIREPEPEEDEPVFIDDDPEFMGGIDDVITDYDPNERSVSEEYADLVGETLGKDDPDWEPDNWPEYIE
jgi:hypothetical protein